MDKFIDSLIKMRASADSRVKYGESFKTASQFLIYGGEFIPYDLIETSSGGSSKLVEINNRFGGAIVTTEHDKALSKFYKEHALKRDINHIVDSIAYLVLPKERSPAPISISHTTKEGDFYHIDTVVKLSTYQGESYHADQENLRHVGKSINDFILQPTHHWLDEVEIDGFDKLPERYWQVAGAFKKRIWGKLQKSEHLDKKVFLCLGVDLENQSLFYGLECLRTGTAKLSTEQIFKFDYLTKDVALLEYISFDQASTYDWGKLLEESEELLSKLVLWYDKVIDYIWSDVVDIKSTYKCIIPVNERVLPTAGEQIDFDKKTQSLAVDLVISYEKEYLKYKGKKDLSKNVAKSNQEKEHYDVLSYHLDGSEKLIKVIASKSSSIQGAIITQSSIEASLLAQDKSYLYIITNLSKKRKSGVLHITKGRFDKMLKTKPASHLVIS